MATLNRPTTILYEPASDAVADAERMADQHLARVDEVERIRAVVRWLDDLIHVPGTKFGFGLDAILGFLVPVIGDLVTGVVSLTVLTTGVRRGVPRIVLARMLVNIGVDTLVGMVPVVGDVFDLLWRANTRNLELLERHDHELEPRGRAGDYAIVGVAVALVGLSVAAPVAILMWLASLLS